MDIADWIFSALDRMGPLPVTLERVARAALPKLPEGRVLADAEKLTLARMADVLLEDCPVKLTSEEVVERFEQFLIQGHSIRAWRCRMLLTLVEYAPIVVFGKPVRYLTLAERKRYVREKLMRGGFPWSTCAKVRYLAYAGAYGHPSANRATGFVPYEERARGKVALRPKEIRHEA